MADDTTDAPETPAAEPPKKGLLVPLLAAVLVGLGAGGATGAFVSGPMLAHRIIPPVDSASLVAELESGVAVPAGKGKKDEKAAEGEAGKEGAKAPTPAAVHSLDNIVMNPSGSNNQRFLLLTVSYELSTVGQVDVLKAHEAEVRDLIQRVVGKRTIDQLGDFALRDSLKAELLTATEGVIGEKTVKKVFFPLFVIQ